MAIVVTNVKVAKNIYVHNDLENTAFYFKEQVKERAETQDRDGIGHDMMACLVMLAFTVEAQFNFLGFKLKGDKWKEKAPTIEKVHTVLKHLDVDNDLSQRPYKTIVDLKTLRDTLAHGKPTVIKTQEKEWKATEEELQKAGALVADYEVFLKEEFVAQAYEDVDAIWKELLKRSGIEIMDAITSGGVEYTVTYEGKG
jgi:hypothetical protein